jgi:hypothetical protein
MMCFVVEHQQQRVPGFAVWPEHIGITHEDIIVVDGT